MKKTILALLMPVMLLLIYVALWQFYGKGAGRHPRRLEHQAYVWQMHWDDSVVEAVKRAVPEMDGFMVLAGEVGFDGKSFAFAPASPNVPPMPRSLTVVLRVKAGFSNALCDDRRAEAVDYVAGLFRSFAGVCQTDGAAAGLQLDYDCPTSGVADYAAFLAVLRQHLGKVEFSITTLPDWFNSEAFGQLIRQTDYFVLQVHSLAHPGDIETPYTLCDPVKAAAHARRAAGYGVPFYIALPTYTYRLLYDDQGRFRSIAAEQTNELPPAGWRVKDVSADPATVAGLVREWQERPPENCLGLAWFRLPVDTDRRNLPWPALEMVMHGAAPRFSIQANLRSPKSGLFELWLLNTGDYVPAEAVSCDVRWKPGAVLAYDVIGGYRVGRTAGLEGIRVEGLAPKPDGQPVMAGWFRASPNDSENKEAVQCGPVHTTSSFGS